MLRLRFVLPFLLGAAAPVVALALSSPSCSLVGLASGGSGGAASSSSASGAGASGGSGGKTSMSASGGSGGAPANCPDEMVEVDVTFEDGGDVRFCIDKFEATNGEYLHYIGDAGLPMLGSNDLCAWDRTREPSVAPELLDPMLPVLGVDWCDARAYCRARKKRLCGAVGEGALPISQQDLARDQWYAACSDNNTRTYPYDTPDASYAYCNDCDPDAGCDATAPIGPDAAVRVGSISTCEGGVPDLFDMSGNAWEWQDSCDDLGMDGGVRAPEYDHCYRRGGGYDVPHVVADGGGNYPDKCLACAVCTGGRSLRKTHLADTGVRCCLDLSQ